MSHSRSMQGTRSMCSALRLLGLGLLTAFIFIPALFTCLSAQIPLSPSPVWQAGASDIPTGIGWADIDGDGWHDLIAANGVDYAYKSNKAYFNEAGVISGTPGWVSADQQPSGNLCTGDLDNDGDQDVVVSNLGYFFSGFPPLPSVVYYNDNGLSASPGWFSLDANSFSCATGDPDGDGDLDIAFAQGNSASLSLQRSMMYINDGGSFGSSPGWQTDSLYYGVDVAFGDVDLDGDLDLALGGRNMGIALFRNDGGVLAATPTWQTHSIIGGRQIAFGDVNGDGYPELAVAEMGDNAGYLGAFFLFENHNGELDLVPSWSCNIYGEPSALAWGDIDGDGDLDLAAGGWNSHLGVFENTGGTLTDSYAWSYSSVSQFSVQAIALADFDEDLLTDTLEIFIGDGEKKLFTTRTKPVHEISSVALNSVPLGLDQYCCDPLEGWVSLSTPPQPGDSLSIRTTFSRDLDLAVTADRIYIFENTAATGIRNPETPEVGRYFLDQNYPNPFNPSTTIRFSIEEGDRGTLSIFDSRGRVLKVFDELGSGPHAVRWDGSDNRGRCVGSGIYFYRLVTGASAEIRKMIMLE